MKTRNSIFVETLGETPVIKVLDFFLIFDSFDYSKSQVAEETGVSRITLDKIWDELKEKKIIVRTRTIGRAEMFRLNKGNPKVKVLMELSLKIATAFAEEDFSKAKKVEA